MKSWTGRLGGAVFALTFALMSSQAEATYASKRWTKKWVKYYHTNNPEPGPAGPQGPQGPAGPAGADGADGAQGPQGPQGPAGADGADGAQGPAGADGADGAEGPQGPQGPAGADGVDGAQGPQGPAGADGADGAQGPQGPVGPQGPAGTSVFAMYKGGCSTYGSGAGDNVLCLDVYGINHPNGYFSVDPNGTITALQHGYYRLKLALFASGSSSYYFANVYKNGASPWPLNLYNIYCPDTPSGQPMHCDTTFPLNAGDTIQVRVSNPGSYSFASYPLNHLQFSLVQPF